MLEEVTYLLLLELMGWLRAYSYLNSVVAISLFGLYLCDLTSVKLNNRTANDCSPFVPEVRASDLVTENTNSLAMATSRLRHLQFCILSVDLFFKTAESSWLVLNTDMFFSRVSQDLLVVQAVLFGQL